MKKIIKRTIAISSILLIISLILGFLQENVFCLNDPNAWRVRGFYLEDKDSLDVVLIGASDVFSGFSAGLAYDEFGFTSYPFATDSASVEIWKSQINEIMRTQHPKCIVVEINGALYQEDNRLYDDASLRKYLDGIPFSINKLETLANVKLKDDYFEYVFPFIKYHSEYGSSSRNLRENLYYKKQGYAKLRGFATYTAIFDNTNTINVVNDKELPLNSNAEKILIDFLEFCKQKVDTNVLFVRFPHLITNTTSLDRCYRCNTASRIIQEYGFEFLNLETDYSEINLDVEHDFYNEDHFNVYGTEKFTSYLGKILVKKYNLDVHEFEEKQQKEWIESVSATKRLFEIAKRNILNGSEEFLSETYDYSY